MCGDWLAWCEFLMAKSQSVGGENLGGNREWGIYNEYMTSMWRAWQNFVHPGAFLKPWQFQNWPSTVLQLRLWNLRIFGLLFKWFSGRNAQLRSQKFTGIQWCVSFSVHLFLCKAIIFYLPQATMARQCSMACGFTSYCRVPAWDRVKQRGCRNGEFVRPVLPTGGSKVLLAGALWMKLQISPSLNQVPLM